MIGLAPTAASAEVLGADLAAPTDTVTKFVQLTAAPPGDRGGATTRDYDPAAHGSTPSALTPC